MHLYPIILFIINNHRMNTFIILKYLLFKPIFGGEIKKKKKKKNQNWQESKILKTVEKFRCLWFKFYISNKDRHSKKN